MVSSKKMAEYSTIIGSWIMHLLEDRAIKYIMQYFEKVILNKNRNFIVELRGRKDRKKRVI